MKSYELRNKYLEFFKEHGHTEIPSASLIPENDPTVLFTTAGMHPLVPYLLGEKHPGGTRLCNVQKCVRTGDIDEVGDNSHCTFFEMLGNWSLGDYFKEEAIAMSHEFLTSAKWLGIDKEKLYFTVFEGDEDAPRDDESAGYWMSHGVDASHIFFLPKKDNWWGPAGKEGPCGPDTEMFIDTGKPACGDDCHPGCSCGKFLEIWNDVFMQYYKNADGTFKPLAHKNVDTGMGLDRTIAVLQGVSSVYDTDIYEQIIKKIEELSGKKYGQDAISTKAMRIVADHIRSATFMLGDPKGITPSNVDQGYILRRLIRRAVRYAGNLGIESGQLYKIAQSVIETYKDHYTELVMNLDKIITELQKEEERFVKTLDKGLIEFEKLRKKMEGTVISGKDAFRLYDTFGFPVEMTIELANENGLEIDIEDYEKRFEEHKQLSHQGAEKRFSGGLADSQEETARLHTATHLLLGALRRQLSDDIEQRGSNITAERLRFDFNFPRKVTPEELKALEAEVNEIIKANVKVVYEEMPIDAARESGATGIFGSKYGDVVKVYTMGKYSKEICGGPHAKTTGELGSFKILKEESSSSGVRRIKAEIK